MVDANSKLIYAKEYWTGDSRDGRLTNGDGYHYYVMEKDGAILEAFEAYEDDDGEPVVTPLTETVGINWYHDLGYSDLENLDIIDEDEFSYMKEIWQEKNKETTSD